MSDMERVSIFIDGSNFYHSMKYECGRSDVDFSEFVSWVVGGRQLVRTYYYSASLPGSFDADQIKKQQRFLASLRCLPYFDIRLGRLEPRGSTYVEKGVDVALAVDMLAMAFRGVYDTAVLVSCDGDYVKAIDAVRDIGRHVEVACFRKAYHLKTVADRVIELDKDVLKPFWLRQS